MSYQIATQFSAEYPGSSVVLYELDENGYMCLLDITGFTSYLHNTSSVEGDPAYIRICAEGIDSESIITVNEPIE